MNRCRRMTARLGCTGTDKITYRDEGNVATVSIKLQSVFRRGATHATRDLMTNFRAQRMVARARPCTGTNSFALIFRNMILSANRGGGGWRTPRQLILIIDRCLISFVHVCLIGIGNSRKVDSVVLANSTSAEYLYDANGPRSRRMAAIWLWLSEISMTLFSHDRYLHQEANRGVFGSKNLLVSSVGHGKYRRARPNGQWVRLTLASGVGLRSSIRFLHPHC